MNIFKLYNTNIFQFFLYTNIQKKITIKNHLFKNLYLLDYY